MDETYKLNPFERAVALIVSVTWAILGVYYAGPWYIETSAKTGSGVAPALYLFPDVWVVNAYGVATIVAGLVASYYAARNNNARLFCRWFLAAILLRTYHFIGTMLAYEHFLPPSYVATFVVLVIAGFLWLWVKYNARIA